MNKVKIKVNNNTSFFHYLINNHICYKSLCISDKDCYLIVCLNDYKIIKRRYSCEIVKYYGIDGIKYFLEYNKYVLISFVLSLITLFILENTIFDIRVNSDDESIKKLIISDLNEYGLSIHKKKKNFEEINYIKKNILDKEKNSLEWLEIREKGCVYIIDVTPRVIKDNNIDNIPSSIYSSNDGVIKHINVISGTRIHDVNDYVHKGDLLISGNILKDDNVVDKVKASGVVYAEVWYTVSISIPFEYEESVYSGIINRYYIKLFDREFTLTGKYNDKSSLKSTSIVLDKSYLPFKVYKEENKIYKVVTHTINETNAYNKAIDISVSKINEMLSDGEYIIDKKVLKKEAKSSKMNIEVFFKIYKNIGITSNLDVIGEKNGEYN